jgi:hypothetical protein
MKKKLFIHPLVFWWVQNLSLKEFLHLNQSTLSYHYLRFSAAGMFTFGGTGAATTGGVTFLTGAAVAVAVGRGG